MIPCCEYSYVKFRNRDGSLDEDIWNDIMKARFSEEWPNDVAENKKPPEPCTCGCHIKGSSVMH